MRKNSKMKRYTKKEREKIIYMLSRGAKVTDIMRETGRSRSGITSFVNKNGYYFKEHFKGFTREQEEELIKLKSKGLSASKVAEEMGVSPYYVEKYIRERDLNLISGKLYWTKDRYEELKQMVLEEKNIIEIAEHFGKSERAIKQKMLIYFGSCIVSKAKETIISYGDVDLYF